MDGANIGAIASAVIAMLMAALALYVNRTDRASKLSRESITNMLEDSRRIRALRTDVWNWEKWGHDVEQVWDKREDELLASGTVTERISLPVMPASELKRLEDELAAAKDDKK